VITTGPYKFVRHPGYLGGILWALSNSFYDRIHLCARAIVQHIVEHLQSFGIEAAEKEYWLVFHDAVNSLFEIGLTCMNEKFKTYDNHFEDELLDISNSLKAMYLRAKSTLKKGHMVPIDIPDKLAILGLEALQSNQPILSAEVITNLFEMSEIDAKISRQRDSIDLSDRLQMIAIFALKKGHKQSAESAIQKLKDFDSRISITQKFPSRLSIDEQMQRFIKWKNDLGRIPALLQDAEEWFYNHVSEDTFMKFKEFWGSDTL